MTVIDRLGDRKETFNPATIHALTGLDGYRTDQRAHSIIEMRQRFATANGWELAEDPDLYDGPAFSTVTLVKPNRFGVPRTSLRLTELTMDQGMPDFCLSLEMLGADTQLRQEADIALRLCELPEDATVYDMTRFTTELDPHVLHEAPSKREVVTDFLELIGGAVNITDNESFAAQNAFWLFTVDNQVKQVLDESGISHGVLTSGNNGDMDVHFCIVNPAASFNALRHNRRPLARLATKLIDLGDNTLAR
ncbi:MAG TPA: hypothetical protein VL362_01460 [Patescibacteria group bacterium]|nr:hypothetical protein [Patescibacteria group bacterium]